MNGKESLITDPAWMEPMLPEESNRQLEDIAFELTSKASSLAGQVHPIVTSAIGNLVRSMNCYYSNLIEGHDTHPRDIDRALNRNLSSQPKKRALQLEAIAHIEVQKAIDQGKDDPSEPLTATYALWLHREFCGRLPDDLLWVEDPHSHRRIRVRPGELRDDEVEVGRHLPPAATALPRFLARFEEAYNPRNLSKISQIVAVAASHHRFLWIHPFFDGNGRVVRLMSHAVLKKMGIGSSLWSVARGLARSVERYKALLMAADEPRRGDLDGRGALSQAALIEFCGFFLATCLDQVEFMRSILEPSELLRRMEIYVEEEMRADRLPKGTFPLLREGLLAGEFERGKAPAITGYAERMARTVVSKLTERGLLVSSSPKGPLRVGFPLSVVERWFPALYPANRI
ncbi:MAG: Fic family protein [Candidatus Acidiferrum sp.]